MILDLSKINDSYDKELIVYDFLEKSTVEIEVLFLFKQVCKYCDKPTCSDKYKEIFLNATLEKKLEVAKEIYTELQNDFYPYGQGLIDTIFYVFTGEV